MNNTKKILAGLACAFLPLILLLFGSLVSTYQTLGNASNIKDSLAESGIYSAVVKEGLDQMGKESSAQATDNIPVDRPEVRSVIEQAVPPKFLEQQTNGVIDGFYAWLHGDMPTMQFELNLTEAKVKLADGLSQYAMQRMDTLPTCTAVDDIPADVDAFNATCLPQGFDKAAAASKVRDEILNSKEFLEDPVINAQDLNTNNTQEVQIGSFTINRDYYNQTKSNLYITGGLAILLAVGIVFLSSTRRIGALRLGIIAAVVGGLSALLAGVLSLILNALAQRVSQSADADVLQRSLVDVVRLLTQDIRNWWLVYGLSLLAAGVITLIILGITRRKQPESTPVVVESPAEAIKTPELPKPEDKLKYPRD